MVIIASVIGFGVFFSIIITIHSVIKGEHDELSEEEKEWYDRMK